MTRNIEVAFAIRGNFKIISLHSINLHYLQTHPIENACSYMMIKLVTVSTKMVITKNSNAYKKPHSKHAKKMWSHNR